MVSSSDMEEGFARNATMNLHSHGRGELEVFQTLVGVHFLCKGGNRRPENEVLQRMAKPTHPLMDIFTPSSTRNARFRNRGLYDRALSQQIKNRSLYTMAHYIISSLYLLQILFAATFTALSAYQRVSSVPLTVLGALNTVIAGLLAWLTGQGMPVRFRAARDQYREVVKAIEATERMFAEIDYKRWPEGQRPDPLVERDRLEQMYKEALDDQRANYPEAHNTPTLDKKREQNENLRQAVVKSDAQMRSDQEEIREMEKDMVFEYAERSQQKAEPSTTQARPEERDMMLEYIERLRVALRGVDARSDLGAAEKYELQRLENALSLEDAQDSISSRIKSSNAMKSADTVQEIGVKRAGMAATGGSTAAVADDGEDDDEDTGFGLFDEEEEVITSTSTQRKTAQLGSPTAIQSSTKRSSTAAKPAQYEEPGLDGRLEQLPENSALRRMLERRSRRG